MAGLSAARAPGEAWGRPRLNPKSEKVALARKLYADKSASISEICKAPHISRAALYRYVNRETKETTLKYLHLSADQPP